MCLKNGTLSQVMSLILFINGTPNFAGGSHTFTACTIPGHAKDCILHSCTGHELLLVDSVQNHVYRGLYVT